MEHLYHVTARTLNDLKVFCAARDPTANTIAAGDAHGAARAKSNSKRFSNSILNQLKELRDRMLAYGPTIFERDHTGGKEQH